MWMPIPCYGNIYYAYVYRNTIYIYIDLHVTHKKVYIQLSWQYIGFDNGNSLDRHGVITSTNADLLSIWHIFLKIKIHVGMLSVYYQLEFGIVGLVPVTSPVH